MLGFAARRRFALGSLGLLVIALATLATHAAYLRRKDASGLRHDVVALVGTGDLALSTNARWLRHPSQAEAGAAASDGPLFFDPDPAGALIGPPLPILGVGAREPARRAR
ncbi:MAG: hypothetical protein H5U40_13805 [Polyangiaceae bacterium]|nr:hypothetical protein [Polyangiaceae bacterium]